MITVFAVVDDNGDEDNDDINDDDGGGDYNDEIYVLIGFLP